MSKMDDKVKERFFKKVNKTDECWLWTGQTDIGGYGVVYIKTIRQKAHRASWLIAGNTIPDDKPVLRHKCRNRNCVRPEHLEVGTHKDNNADMIRDGTVIYGENHAFSKLTDEKVLEIRSKALIKSYREVANEFGISKSLVNNIIHRKTWKHL